MSGAHWDPSKGNEADGEKLPLQAAESTLAATRIMPHETFSLHSHQQRKDSSISGTESARAEFRQIQKLFITVAAQL